MERGEIYRNVGILGATTALNRVVTSILVATSALIGAHLAGDPAWATLPIALQFVAQTAAVFPASMMMKRYGRRAGFVLGCAIGGVGAALCAYGIYVDSFPYFTVGIVIVGFYNGFAQFYRFAAADSVPEDMRGKVISLVLAGGIVAGFVGPSLAAWSKDLIAPFSFAGSYVVVAIASFLGILLLAFLRMPRPSLGEWQEKGRPLRHIAMTPKFAIAVLVGTVSYVVMAFVMSVTPLAMLGCGHVFGDAAFVIQWHVVAMFAPAFITGHLIHRFGATTVILMGGVMFLACAAIAMSGLHLFNFWAALVLLGFGWAFMFVGATTLVTEVHTAPERAKTQALNDLIVFGAVAIASFLSAPVLAGFGWTAVILISVPPVLLAMGATLFLHFRRPALAA